MTLLFFFNPQAHLHKRNNSYFFNALTQPSAKTQNKHRYHGNGSTLESQFFAQRWWIPRKKSSTNNSDLRQKEMHERSNLLNGRTCLQVLFEQASIAANFENQTIEGMQYMHIKTGMPLEELARNILNLMLPMYLQHEIALSL